MGSIDKAKTQVAKTDTMSIQTLIQKSASELGKALPSHMNPERLVRIALTTLRTTPKLMSCNPQSFLAALFTSAQLGLEPNVEGQAYIIPYGTEAQFQIGYKGYVELFYRHGLAVSLDAQAVYENDDFDFEYGTASYLRHKPALTGRGEVKCYYAVAKLKGSANLFKVMGKDECLEHGKKHSKAFNTAYSPWQTDQEAMCKKTVVIQIMKLIPKSIEIQKAIAMDDTIKTRVKADMFDVKDETKWQTDTETVEIEGKLADSDESEAQDTKDVFEKEKPLEGKFEPQSSKSEPDVLRSDIIEMCRAMDRSLLSFTKSENFAGTDDPATLKDTISEGKKKSQLMVQHSIIKKEYSAWVENKEINLDEE